MKIYPLKAVKVCDTGKVLLSFVAFILVLHLQKGLKLLVWHPYIFFSCCTSSLNLNPIHCFSLSVPTFTRITQIHDDIYLKMKNTTLGNGELRQKAAGSKEQGGGCEVNYGRSESECEKLMTIRTSVDRGDLAASLTVCDSEGRCPWLLQSRCSYDRR